MKVKECLDPNQWQRFFEEQLKEVEKAGLFREWFEDIPADRQQGRDWRRIAVEGNSYHCHNATDELYPETSAGWEFGKVVVTCWLGHYFFGAHCIKNTAIGLYRGTKTCLEIFPEYVSFKDDSDFSWRTFAEHRMELFAESGQVLKQAAKDVALFSALYFNPSFFGLPVGTAIQGTIMGCAMIRPLSFRKLLGRVENWWRPENIKPLGDIKNLTVFEMGKAIFNGSYTLSHFFNSHCLGINQQKE